MLTRARRKLLVSLGQRTARVREELFLLEGPRSIHEALEAGAPVQEILLTHALTESAAGEELAGAGTDRAITVTTISENDCRLISDTRTPQGAIAVMARSDLGVQALDGDGLVLALDHVSDPGNVGTLVRAADAFSCRAVVAGPGTADFENPKVLRAAMGSNFHLPLVTVADLPETLGRLAEQGAGVFAATLSGADAYKAGESVGRRVCRVLGNEARGVSSAVLAAVSEEVTVPCPGRAESLNVAMAGTVLLSIFTRAAGGSR